MALALLLRWSLCCSSFQSGAITRACSAARWASARVAPASQDSNAFFEGGGWRKMAAGGAAAGISGWLGGLRHCSNSSF